MKRSNNKIFVTDYDKTILYAFLSLIVIGLLIQLDINSVRNSMVFFYKQFAFALVSLVLALFTLFYINLDKLRRWNMALIVLTIVLLALVLWRGTSIKGAVRGINFGIVNFQPSYLARVALIFYVANIIDKKREELSKSGVVDFIKHFLPLLVIAGSIYALIMAGQHFSALVISAASLVCLLFLGGLKFRIVGILLLVTIIGAFAIIKMGASFRSERLDIFKKYCLLIRDDNIKIEKSKEYQVKESLTALTSGKLFGTGADRGRAKHYYLPEARTDYVFTVVGEQFGFLGAIVVFGLHCLLFIKTMLMAYKQTDFYLRLVAMGLSLNIFFNVLVNVGVSMSILPSTGNTLPFISYGGTALLIDSISIGAILSISAKRKLI
ncbi:MAG: FtsW/RodA/SpoVE family cell cycle protein [Candidatus Cloacimonadaceae bacterium]